MTLPEWDERPTPSGVEAMAEEYLRIEEEYRILGERRAALAERLAALTPNEPGETTIAAGHLAVTVKRQEKWTWDSDVLEKMFAARAMPEYVKVKLTVQKRAFERLAPEAQDDLLPALTRGPGAPSIKVERVKPVAELTGVI